MCRPKLYSVPNTESFVNDALAEKMSLRDRAEGEWKSGDIKGVVQGEDHGKPNLGALLYIPRSERESIERL